MAKLSERDVCTKFITLALAAAGWDLQTQIRGEVSFTKGRIIVRVKGKRADHVLYSRPNQPIALIEAKDQTYGLGAGMQQGLDYAKTLDIPFVFSSNGDGFLFHYRTGNAVKQESELTLDEFPSPAEFSDRYCAWRGLAGQAIATAAETPYYDDGSDRLPRYYQVTAVNRTVEAVARGDCDQESPDPSRRETSSAPPARAWQRIAHRKIPVGSCRFNQSGSGNTFQTVIRSKGSRILRTFQCFLRLM